MRARPGSGDPRSLGRADPDLRPHSEQFTGLGPGPGPAPKAAPWPGLGDLAAAALAGGLFLAFAAGWDRASPPRFGEPAGSRWIRKCAEHPARSALAAACLMLAAGRLRSEAPGGARASPDWASGDSTL